MGRQTASGSISLTQRVLNFSSQSLSSCVCVCVCTHGLYTCLTFVVDMDILYITLDITLVTSGHQSLGTREAFFVEDNSLPDYGGGMVWDDSNTFYLLCLLFLLLLLLPQLHLRLSGIRILRLGPALSPSKFMVSYTLEV